MDDKFQMTLMNASLRKRKITARKKRKTTFLQFQNVTVIKTNYHLPTLFTDE
jgi:hypothetical protein